ncbi:MAG: hypothetical protein BBJ57_06405 [Desulfobacterales bacterium PC51MH44]|nr:MAG: hypothetical protein BBJ57_06405 [Desulfobacterales bacterium PC51MH44]
MKPERMCLASSLLATIILAYLIAPRPAYGTLLYKSYIIRYDRGWDILCDPYVVKKDDWVYKLFRQRGEIAHKDFPEFLRLFKRLNPHIRDINRIRPGQHIVIPLKKLSQGALPGQSSGVVTIPFVGISNKFKTLKKYSAKYKVQKGDCVSLLIARRYGAYGSELFEQGIKLFRLINPQIEDPNRIYVDQMIRIPDPAIRNQPWYQALFDSSAGIKSKAGFDSLILTDEKTPKSFVSEDRGEQPKPPLSEVASVLDAKLFNKGAYYFPIPGRKDFELDLSRFPFIVCKDGTRMIFLKDNKNQEAELNMVTSFWKDVHVVRTAPNDSLEKVFDAVIDGFGKDVLKNRLSFSDHGVAVAVRGQWIIDKPAEAEKTVRHVCITLIDNPSERTSESIARYLDQNNIIIKEVLKGKSDATQKINSRQDNNTAENVITIVPSDREAFVNDLLSAMGYRYTPSVNILFPYAGIEIKAVSNLATKNNKRSFLVDFGELYGDAVDAIEKSGLNVTRVKDNDHFHVIMQKLLDAMDVSYTDDPTFFAAQRPAIHNTTLTIPGFLIASPEKPKILLSLAPLHDEVMHFLANKGVKIIRIELPGKI